MSTFKVAALAAALAGGAFALAPADAQANPYAHHYGHHQGHGWRRPAPPVWVPPKVQRKQLELQERFVEKYGVVRPYHYGYRPHYGYGYGHPRHYGPRYRPGW